ncbi:MAG: glycosyltransferase family 8 protein [Cyanobacteria bacterium RUI128]|nr:glycosyltransferase family 8 protein [Cyanobacteria bacterium RUI128]
MEKINIAFGVTKDWLEYTYTTICSVLSNGADNEHQFFIMCDIPEEEFKKDFETFQKRLNYPRISPRYIEMDNSDFEGIVHDERVGVSALYRLRLPSLTDVDKIVYLDSDVVILDDISKLWNYDIENYLVGAVEDKYSDLMTCRADLRDDEIYFNSGVMLMNLKKFREEKLEEKIFDKLKESGNDYSDQDVLNYICQNRVLYLPLKYNLMLTTDDPNAFPKRKDEYAQALNQPVILHYSIKPWILPVQHSEHWRKYNDMLKAIGQ